MNISGLIKNFLGDAQPSEPKTLELKSGEVVKGMVIQVLSEQDAILNIGGVQVRAKLETPLKQGEVTLLQVQPESASGQVVLKPLDASVVQIADGSLAEILKNVGLADTASNRQLIQTLHQAGISLNKETVQAFAQLQSQLPASMAQEEWLPSAIIAQQKGIPLTPESVNAVRAAVSGPGFHETLQQLESQMTKLLNDNPSLSASTKAALDTFKQVMTSVKEMSAQLLPQSTTTEDASMNGLKGQVLQEGKQITAQVVSNSNNQTGTLTSAASAAGQQASSAGNVNAQSAGDISNLESMPQTAVKTANTIALGTSKTASPMLEQQLQPTTDPKATVANAALLDSSEPMSQKTTGRPFTTLNSGQTASVQNEGEQMFSDGKNDNRISSTNEQVKNETVRANTSAELAGGNTVSASESKDQAAKSVLRATAAADEAVLTTHKGDPASEHWIPKLMKALGVDHENQLFKLPEMKANEGAVRMDGGVLQPGAASPAITHEQLKMADSLKSVLMQLSQSQDIPPAMKETVQQAVQQITGQQLMLNSDRSSMFTHITMFVPLLNANGEQTAAIHIQSRKGKRGEIDAQNCRLVFDLRMKALGDTMVDVKVVDRIVSLQVMNDQPFLHDLLDSYREEISSSLSGIGYQFISLKCSSYPEKGLASEDTTTSSRLQDTSLPARLLDLYGNKQYKGMDVKV
ncbi:hypothetical protein [Paenibacillus sp. UNC451MF]|uniref:hypothetical protein n=1 Tax=Paenibacillus sp. UNC451MF TaxID=1449063 RepID=UPI00048BFC75|nr:hypothetical protein [Paenibacillus sp. UNC451MF]